MRRSNPFSRLLAFAAALVLILLVARRAEAIPAFARRYETSCQTCHVAFPRLTPFGEAFRRNGYRFPDGGDATAVKEEMVSLGADANKDVWPKGAVYPGEIASRVPLAVFLDAKLAWGKHFEEAHGAASHDHAAAATDAHSETMSAKFTEVTARLLSGGSLGSIASYYASISFGGHSPVELERASVTLLPIDSTTLHLKIGRFEPALHGVSIHRGIFGHQLRLTTTAVGLDPFVPEMALLGAEASGLVAGRVGWAAGLVENAAPVEQVVRDFYGRTEIKIGGMRLDGVGYAGSSQPWRERSLIIGVSGYRGRAKVTASVPTLDHDDTFVRAGADAHAIFDDFMLDVVIARQRHDGPTEIAGDSRSLDLAYAELTHVTFPWLLPSVRFERSQVLGATPKIGPKWIGLAALTLLLRPNVLLRAEGAFGADPGGHAGFRFAALSVSAGI